MIWILCIFTLLFSSCEQKPQEATYKEVVIQAPGPSTPAVPQVQLMQQGQPAPGDQSMPADPHAGLDMSAMSGLLGGNSGANNIFTWAAPQGWKEDPGTGMRLATFHLAADAKAIDCSLVSLGGMAGGLEANLKRWMGQIGVQATSDELTGLITSASDTAIKTGQSGKVFDFTTIQTKARPSDKSMIVVMIPVDGTTLFVKMAGTVATVSRNKDGFFKLVSSVEYHAPSDQAATPAVTVPDAELKPSSTDPHAGLDMSAMSGLIDAPTSQNILAWASPEGWIEEPGKHMRMVSFHAQADPKAVDCYIIALSGPAGGTEANLNRWMGQLGLEVSDDNLKQLIVSARDFKTKDGIGGKVFDFTLLQSKGNPSDKSMIAAMFPLDKMTVFIKMNGTIASVKQYRDNFLKLLGSITRK